MPESLAKKKKRAEKIVRALEKEYPDAECALRFENPFQLLIATILSAQCTDVRVNEVTKTLFKRYPDPLSFARAEPEELEEAIRPTGFFRNKTKSIQACCESLIEKHDGEVPGTMAELTDLAGVGRKTANVILGNCFGVPGIVVDTHFGRLSRRMGFTDQKDPVKVEREVGDLIPPEDQVLFCHRMIRHGREVCGARRPRCEVCVVERECPQIGVEGEMKKAGKNK